jgi:hypothetical protein
VAGDVGQGDRAADRVTEEVEPVETLAGRESIDPVDLQVQPVVLRWLVAGVDLQLLGRDGGGVRELRDQRRIGHVRGDPDPGKEDHCGHRCSS